jgi:hypothetical protein
MKICGIRVSVTSPEIEYEYDLRTDNRGYVKPREYSFQSLWHLVQNELADIAANEALRIKHETGNFTKVRYVLETHAQGEVITRNIA